MIVKKIKFTKDDEEYSLDCLPNTDIYKLCKLLDTGGAENIRTCTVYETVDDLYLQGRSTRNLPSVSPPKRQLELF